MTNEPKRARLPRSVASRERLREAQRAEADALAAVERAELDLSRAEAKRDEAVAAANSVVDRARRALGASHHQLVSVSGVDRTAGLIGLTTAALRRSVADRQESQ